NPARVRMFGPKVPLSPRLAVVLAMILHEIATNAAKYGALSNDTGTVALDWEIIEESDGRKLRLVWTEAGGPHVTAPVQRGFGSRLIERSARDQLGGEATVDFLPRGVVYTITCSLQRDGEWAMECRNAKAQAAPIVPPTNLHLRTFRPQLRYNAQTPWFEAA